MSDQTTPAVQPEGQGEQEATGTGLYDLASAPEEYRPFLEAELKKIEGNATKKFQDAADYRKRWEPYESLGIADVPPEEMQNLLGLYELAQDETKFDEWLKSTAEQRGLLGATDDELDDDEDGDDLDIGKLVETRLQEALAPIMEQLQATQQAQRVQHHAADLDRELTGLAEQRSLELDDEDKDAVYALAAPFADDDPDGALQKGLEAYLRISGGAQRKLVESKVTQPNGAMEGGQPNTAPDEIKTFSAASKAARERFRGSS
jgi:hypothetical protein